MIKEAISTESLAPLAPAVPKATKDDLNKAPLASICPMFLIEMAEVLALGDKKYGRMNWSAGQGLEYERLISAAQRHILAFTMGDEYDADDGLSHLVHAASCCMMLHNMTTNGVGIDDRRFKIEDFRK